VISQRVLARRPAQWAVASSLIVLLVLGTVRLLMIDGWLRRVTVDGPSMATTFCGARYLVTCGDCRFPFLCDAEHVPAERTAVCPNCGYADNPLDPAPLLPPEQVLIDCWPTLFGVGRGDVVAFGAAANEPQIKRVAALPGERPAIREGELYINDAILRKARRQRHELRTLVHDNRYQPLKTTSLAPRWRPAQATSGWRDNHGVLSIEQPRPADDEFDWVEYEHWPCTSNLQQRGIPSEVLDDDPYNQGDSRRSLNPVYDVHLTCRLILRGSGRMAFAATDRGEHFQVAIEPGRVVLLQNGKTVVQQPILTRLNGDFVDVEFGLCDHAVFVYLNDQAVLTYVYEPSEATRVRVLHPLAIGSAGPSMTVSHLSVWRDVYYLNEHGLPDTWQGAGALGARHVAVLGDNQPVSLDSRQWDSPGLPVERILGVVYRPFWLGCPPDATLPRPSASATMAERSRRRRPVSREQDE
jgi:type IV secretory pathway protease TraF